MDRQEAATKLINELQDIQDQIKEFVKNPTEKLKNDLISNFSVGFQHLYLNQDIVCSLLFQEEENGN